MLFVSLLHLRNCFLVLCTIVGLKIPAGHLCFFFLCLLFIRLTVGLCEHHLNRQTAHFHQAGGPSLICVICANDILSVRKQIRYVIC